MGMTTPAIVLNAPRELVVDVVELRDPVRSDVVVDVSWSGISTGTEKLLWNGRMPPFPGLGYPLVPGYEAVGTVVEAGPDSGRQAGDTVFVPGAHCYATIRGLFGASAARLVVAGDRCTSIAEDLGDAGVLLALAATAHHALAGHAPIELVVGHGVLGRLIPRIAVALGYPPPTVWEQRPERRDGAAGYRVFDAASDNRRDYAVICDASGDASLLDSLISRLSPGGEIVLAGFYDSRIDFAFAPAFMREARLRIAAEWKPSDLAAVNHLVAAGALSLDGLISHRAAAKDAPSAYRTAFEQPDCLKMVLDWRGYP
jgi:bacteriochlorophyllide a dehydrogenase